MAYTPSFSDLSPEMKAMLVRQDPTNQTGLLSPVDMQAAQGGLSTPPAAGAASGLSVSGIPGLASLGGGGGAAPAAGPAKAPAQSTASSAVGPAGSHNIGQVGSSYTIPSTINIRGF